MPPRRSSRRSTATKKGPQDPTVAFVSTDGGQPKTALGANKSKKRKVVKEIPNKPQVVKCAVANLSVELFLEVGSYCDLADLLNLSRANKWLHGVFSSRSASSCWKQAAQNEQSEGLPPCPDDLNLRRYVSLMMDQHCERCDEDDGYNTVLWAARERLCRRCIKTHYRAALPNFLLPNMYGYEKLMAIKIYLPDERHYHYGHIRGATRYAVKEIKLLKEVVPGMSVGELAKMMGLIVGKRAKENNAVHTVWLYGRYQAVAEERHAIEQKAYQKNLELSLKLERERESKRKAAVEKRWEAIKAKLTEAGFDDVLTVEVCTSLVRQRQSVNQEHRFIDKEWSELRKEPIPILNDLRIKLAEHRRKDVLVVRLVQLKSLIDEVTTSDADFANIPSCHYANFAMDSDVEDKIRKFPGNGELSPEVLDIMREKCTSKKLQQDFEWRLTRQFPSLAKQHEDQSLSHHPLALFRCDSCNAGKTDPLTSITVMHPCLCNRFTPRTLSLLEKVPGGAYDYGVREVFQFAPWKFEHLKLHWNSGAMKP